MHPWHFTDIALLSNNTHAANRTIVEWAWWAQGEGFTNIVEKAPKVDGGPEADIPPFSCFGVACFHLSDKVYCTLYARSVTASSSGIKQHCVRVTKKGKLKPTEHAKKAQKRKWHQKSALQPLAVAPPSQSVCRFTHTYFRIHEYISIQVHCPIK